LAGNLNLHFNCTSNVSFYHLVATHALSLLEEQGAVACWAWHALASSVITLKRAETSRNNFKFVVESKNQAIM
jgi:hypothetical protein